MHVMSSWAASYRYCHQLAMNWTSCTENFDVQKIFSLACALHATLNFSFMNFYGDAAYLHMRIWCWSWGKRILREPSLCCSVVYYYNGARWYEQLIQVGQLYRALILLGLDIFLNFFYISKHLCIYFCYVLNFLFLLHSPSHLRLLLPTGLPSWQWYWTGPIMLIVLFLVSHFNFLFVPCDGLSWLPVSFLLHVKYTLSYRIVSSY